MNYLQVNNKYILTLFNKKNNNNIEFLFKNGIGVYLVNLPTPKWYDFHKLSPQKNYSEKKKLKFFSLMKKGSFIVSPTEVEEYQIKTNYFEEENIFHFSNLKEKRISQVFMTFQIIKFLFKRRKFFEYCLVYNFYPCEMMVAFFVKFMLQKKIIVDFEDDYTKINKSILYGIYFNLVKFIPDKIICINELMKNHFDKSKCFVHNGFFNLNYYKNINTEFKDNCKFLFSGTLDEIRGVDLIPDLINSLRKKVNNFKLIITGSGKLENLVKSWDFKELTYLGYLDECEYETLIQEVDFCLVLQKPDMPFNAGSFPSKIEYYAKFCKPIYILDTIN